MASEDRELRKKRVGVKDTIVTLLQQNKVAEALSLAQTLCEGPSPDTEGFTYLAQCYSLLGRLQDAFNAAQKAVAHDQASNAPWYWLARILIAGGHSEKAVKAIDSLYAKSVSLDKISAISKDVGWIKPVELHWSALPYARLSYSNSGQDQVIAKILKHKLAQGALGSYVDIGANSAIATSNTYFFYTLGWSGVCIDARDSFRKSYEHYRSRDVFVSALVGDDNKTAFFADHKTNTGMARIGATLADFDDGFETPHLLPSRSLGSILADVWPNGHDIDFFSIDVEGSEERVLRSNDWTRFRPYIICAEDPSFSYDQPQASGVVNYLRELGYIVACRMPSDIIFMDQRRL